MNFEFLMTIDSTFAICEVAVSNGHFISNLIIKVCIFCFFFVSNFFRECKLWMWFIKSLVLSLPFCKSDFTLWNQSNLNENACSGDESLWIKHHFKCFEKATLEIFPYKHFILIFLSSVLCKAENWMRISQNFVDLR